MIDFSTTGALAAHVGLHLDASDPRGANFPSESDWGIFRGSGFGLPGSDEGGWLVTFAAAPRMADSGYLIAHAVQVPPSQPADLIVEHVADKPEDTPPTFGGRCLLLGGPGDRDLEKRLLQAAREQDWFESRAGGAKVNLEMLDLWLKESGHGLG